MKSPHHAHHRRRRHRKSHHKAGQHDESDEHVDLDEVLEDENSLPIPPPPVVTLTPSTEESAKQRSPSEENIFKELNEVATDDEEVPHARIIQPKPTQNKLSPIMHNRTPVGPSPSSSESEDSGSSQAELLFEDLESHQKKLIDDERHIDFYEDPKLIATTERNRHIPSPEPPSPPRASSLRGNHRRLVFTEPVITEKPDLVKITQFYGMSGENPTLHRKSRLYLVACDFSKESHSAKEWAMGTIMRDGDEIHLVTIINDEKQDLAEFDMTPAMEILSVAKSLNTKAKVLMSHMLLFDVKLVITAIRGHVRETLTSLIEELPLTMVICGCRGRSTVKGMLMGSISTYLIQKSPVPVTVIRYHKKKKHRSHKKTETHVAGLSESMRTGHLVVDELSAAR